MALSLYRQHLEKYVVFFSSQTTPLPEVLLRILRSHTSNLIVATISENFHHYTKTLQNKILANT
jgi:hypothetical protein